MSANKGILAMFTTKDASRKFKKDQSHIRRVCIEHDIGVVKYGRIRLLSERDMKWLAKYFQENGRTRQKSVAS